MKILIISDSLSSVENLKTILTKRYTVDTSTNVDDAVHKNELVDYMAVILDIAKRTSELIAITSRLRQGGISAAMLAILPPNDIDDYIALIDAGVDYFVARPVYEPELLARLRSLTRREHVCFNVNKTLAYKDLVLDLDSYIVKRSGVPIKLRRKEFEVLHYLIKNPGRAINREMIMSNVWEFGDGPWNNTIDVHIKHLRDKIDKPFDEQLIKTAHGIGYMIL